MTMSESQRLGKIVRAFLLVVGQAMVDLEQGHKVAGAEFLKDLRLHVANLGYVLPKDAEWIVQGVEVMHRALLEEADGIRTELARMSSEEGRQASLRRRVRVDLFDAIEGLDGS